MSYIYDVNFDDTLVYPRSLEEHVDYLRADFTGETDVS